MIHALLVAATLAAPCLALAADVVGTLTILEGQGLIYRGSGRLQAAEGVRIVPGDIVETAAATFTQIEFSDQSTVQFGPSTRVLFINPGSKQKSDRSMYLMSGWLKVAGGKRDAGAEPGFELRSAQFELAEIPPGPSVFVLRSQPAGVELFIENGSARMGERQPGNAAPTVVSLRSGDFYQRKFPSRGAVSKVASQAFVAEVPRPFRDSLPPRAERFRERQVQPKEAPPFDYADIGAWLQAEPAVRRALMSRWRGKAQEPAFRAALVSNLRAHPEWDPILFPEKYRPKEPPRPAAVVARPASEAASTAAR